VSIEDYSETGLFTKLLDTLFQTDRSYSVDLDDTKAFANLFSPTNGQTSINPLAYTSFGYLHMQGWRNRLAFSSLDATTWNECNGAHYISPYRVSKGLLDLCTNQTVTLASIISASMPPDTEKIKDILYEHFPQPESGSYFNEADPFIEDWQQSQWGPHYGRLFEIKQRYDPLGLFVCWHCVGSELYDFSPETGAYCLQNQDPDQCPFPQQDGPIRKFDVGLDVEVVETCHSATTDNKHDNPVDIAGSDYRVCYEKCAVCFDENEYCLLFDYTTSNWKRVAGRNCNFGCADCAFLFPNSPCAASIIG
jgi:hypothetical protein